MPTFQKGIQNQQILLIVHVRGDGGNAARDYDALLDTGSQGSMISPKVVEEVDLKAFGYTSIIPASGQSIRTRKYRIELGLPIDIGDAFMSRNSKMDVAELPFQPTNFDVLLGMDFLMKLHFTMYGGSFILSN